MADLELDTIRHALSVARREGLGELHLEQDGATFSAVLPPAQSKVQPKVPELNGAAESKADPGPKVHPIAATCVGFYRPSESVLKVGAKISAGDIVATITALGLANDVESPVAGEIVEILAEPEQPVEYGQPIALVREER